MNAKKFKRVVLSACVKYPDGTVHNMASPFRRRYIGFRLLGKSEQLMPGDQYRIKKWVTIRPEFFWLAETFFGLGPIRRKL